MTARRPTRQMTPTERDAAKDRALEAANAFAAAWRDEPFGADIANLYVRFVVAYVRVQTNIAAPGDDTD